MCACVRDCVVPSSDLGGNPALQIADVACGNLRFEAHLMQEFPDVLLQVAAFDNCDELVPDQVSYRVSDCVSTLASGHIPGWMSSSATSRSLVVDHSLIDFYHCDVMEALRNNTLSEQLCNHAPARDIAVAFGFMHHAPLFAWQIELIQALVDATRAGGLVALSLWRFMDNESMAAKARRTHEEALDVLGWRQQARQFGTQDVLMGWQNKPGAYRYCHSFTTQEIDALVSAVSDRADIIARFRADGRTHDLNEYLILKVKA